MLLLIGYTYICKIVTVRVISQTMFRCAVCADICLAQSPGRHSSATALVTACAVAPAIICAPVGRWPRSEVIIFTQQYINAEAGLVQYTYMAIAQRNIPIRCLC